MKNIFRLILLGLCIFGFLPSAHAHAEKHLLWIIRVPVDIKRMHAKVDKVGVLLKLFYKNEQLAMKTIMTKELDEDGYYSGKFNFSVHLEDFIGEGKGSSVPADIHRYEVTLFIQRKGNNYWLDKDVQSWYEPRYKSYQKITDSGTVFTTPSNPYWNGFD